MSQSSQSTPNSQHWLIVYAQRRYGQAEWQIANDSHKGPLTRWLKSAQSDACETVLLNAVPISAYEYKWVKDNV